MQNQIQNLPDRDLAYLSEGTEHFQDYIEAVEWAQNYAQYNRETMMYTIIKSLKENKLLPRFTADIEMVNCHHNYISKETHFNVVCVKG